MKHKKIISTLLFILCFQFILGFFVVQVNAADAVAEAPGIDFVPSVAIPGASFLKGDCVEPENVGKPCMRILGSFEATKGVISGMYKFGLGIAGILATIMIAFGGITWLSSGGNASQIQRAKQYITGALTGLVLGLLSYTMLYIVNPDIVELKTNPKGVEILKNIEGGCGFVKAGICEKDGQSEISKDATRCGKYPEKTSKEESWECCCNKKIELCSSLITNPDGLGGALMCGDIAKDSEGKSCIGGFCKVSDICKLNLDSRGSYIPGGTCYDNNIPIMMFDKKGDLIKVPSTYVKTDDTIACGKGKFQETTYLAKIWDVVSSAYTGTADDYEFIVGTSCLVNSKGCVITGDLIVQIKNEEQSLDNVKCN